MAEISRKRLLFIDVARTYAIFLALISHAFVAIGLYEQMGSNAIMIRQFTRMATPMFVFMFGFMVEFIYVRKTEIEGYGYVNKRIFIRSFQCYIAYGLTSFCAFLGGYKSIEGFVASLLFFSDSRFGNILRAYCLILLITPFIIKFRLKYGIKWIFISLIILILSYSFIENLPAIDFGIFNHPMNILSGYGLHKGGPSVWGSLSFYLAGIIFASSIRSIDTKMDKKISLVLLSILIILGFFLIDENFNKMWIYFSEGIYRKNNSPGYYIIGIIGSLITISIIQFLIGSKSYSRSLRYILPIGTSSLISYTTGNIILNLINIETIFINQFLFIILFFSLVMIITINISKFPWYKEISEMMELNFDNILKKVKTK